MRDIQDSIRERHVHRAVGECNTAIKSQQNEKDPKTMQVCDCTVEYDLKELIDTIYTNNIHLLFGSLSLKNFTVKLTQLEIVMRWMTFWKIDHKACE